MHSPALEKTHVVEPKDWANIWVYGQRVYLCGWMNKHNFRVGSRHLPPHSPVKQYRRTATANRALPIGERKHIVLGHGSGGRLSAELIERVFLPAFSNPTLDRLDDLRRDGMI